MLKQYFLRSTIIFFFCSAFALRSYGQTKEEIIKTIRADFQAINNDKSLSKKTLSNEEIAPAEQLDGGLELTGYYKSKDLVKMVHWVGLSYGNRTREFYFKNNHLFFVYEKFESFVVTKDSASLDHSRTNTSFEGRYYFNDDKLIDQKISGKRILDDGSEDIVKTLLESAKDNRTILNKEKKNKGQ